MASQSEEEEVVEDHTDIGSVFGRFGESGPALGPLQDTDY